MIRRHAAIQATCLLFLLHPDGATVSVQAVPPGEGEWDRLSTPGSASGLYSDSITHLKQWRSEFGGNDHWYGVLAVTHDWIEADSAARSLTLDSLSGYLATIQGASENAFIFDSVLAGVDPPSVEKQFLLGGAKVGGAWQWTTGETVCYLNWASGEPTSQPLETVLAIWGPTRQPQPNPVGSWNNTRPDDALGASFRFWSVVEWGAPTLSPNVVCGDGKAECGEACDDGNLANNDGCNSACRIELCGDLDANGYVQGADFAQLINFLYADSSITAHIKYADLDDFDLITLRDALYLSDHLAFGGVAPVCPPGQERIIPARSPYHRIEHTSLVPAHASSVVVLFRLVILDSGVARAVNLAVQFSIDGVAATIDSVDTDLDWSRSWVNVEPVGALPGTLAAGLLEPYGAQYGTSELLRAYLTVAPSPFPRLLTVDHIELPPLMEDRFGEERPVHHTVILDNTYAGWIPDTAACPIANTGDVNLDLDLTAADVIWTVNYVFKSGYAPLPCPAAADLNCSGQVTSADVIYLVNHVFRGGAAPCDACFLIPEVWSCAP